MAGRTISVMGFNIRGASHRDGINAREGRAPLNVGTIKRYPPDVIGFQELHARGALGELAVTGRQYTGPR